MMAATMRLWDGGAREGAAKKTRAMVFMPGQGAAHGVVEVYRDGEAVVVRGEGGGIRQTPMGLVEVAGKFEMRFPSVQAYDWAKARAFEKDPVRYTKFIGAFGLDDDARNAPQLPSAERRDPEVTAKVAADYGALLLLPPGKTG